MSIELRHRDMEILQQASAELATAFEGYPKVEDVEDGFAPGKRQMDFTIHPQAQQLGLTAQAIARQLRYSFYGVEVLRQQRGRHEIKVNVRLPQAERSSLYNIEEFVVRTPRGTDVMLRDVARITPGRAYTRIDRRNGHRAVTVTADVTPPSLASGIVETILKTDMPQLQQRYPGLQFGLEGRQADRIESLRSLGYGMLAALAIIYVLLAVAFRSYIQPMIVMTGIPFGMVGAIVGHLIMGYSLSLVSMFGIVALSGVVVNDALVLIDFANRERDRGREVAQAILNAATTRFRAVILTTLTTFGGLAPMIFETSRQARFLIPMAISLGFGILFATLITLILIPSLFLMIEDLRKARQWIVGLLTRPEPSQAPLGDAPYPNSNIQT